MVDLLPLRARADFHFDGGIGRAALAPMERAVQWSLKGAKNRLAVAQKHVPKWMLDGTRDYLRFALAL